jgi:hypothetical protein
MAAQNYSAVDAYRRWSDCSLSAHLRVIRRNYLRHRLRGLPTDCEYRSLPDVGTFAKWRTVILGHVTWAVFTRAYWAIYQPGGSHPFYGSVLVSGDGGDESTPALFEIAEYSRRVKEFDVPLEGIEEYARVIRNDDAISGTIDVPAEIAMKPGVLLQDVVIERQKLPCGYLHHRLVPVVFLRGSQFVSIVHHRYWGDEFRTRWCAGDPPLTEEELRLYRADFPEVVP